jgi:hypothetical protein
MSKKCANMRIIFRVFCGERRNRGLLGGGGGIRTHEGLSSLPVFKTGAFNHSATPPEIMDLSDSRRRCDCSALVQPLKRARSKLKLPHRLRIRGAAQPRGEIDGIGAERFQSFLVRDMGRLWRRG